MKCVPQSGQDRDENIDQKGRPSESVLQRQGGSMISSWADSFSVKSDQDLAELYSRRHLSFSTY
jgi:hypothetical protein